MRFPATSDSGVNTRLNHIAETLSAMRLRAIESDRYFETIISSTATGILVADTRGNILLTNPAALALLGRPALAYVSALRPSWPGLADLLTDPVPSGSHTVGNLSVNTSVFTTHSGERRIIATLDDITPQLQAATVDSWTEMSRVLTHEIMNGIAPVISIADTLMQRDDHSRPYLTDALEAISESSRSLSNFVERYNRITRVPAPEPTDFPISPLINQAITLTTPPQPIPTDTPAGSDSCPSPDIHIGLPAVPVTIHADRGQILQVLVNLLKNAREASPSHITITARSAGATPGAMITITVENDGQPIPPADADRIFTPFFTTKPGGNGIGLSLSRRIITLNHGTLTLTSTIPVTRFTLNLPASL